MAPEVYDLLRDDLGFEGVMITDSLGMGAVGGRPTPALQALEAGADLLLMPADTAATHQIVSTPSTPAAPASGSRRPLPAWSRSSCGRPGWQRTACAPRRRRAGTGRQRGPAVRGVLVVRLLLNLSGPAGADSSAIPGQPGITGRSGRQVRVTARRSFWSASRSSWRTRSAEMP